MGSKRKRSKQNAVSSSSTHRSKVWSNDTVDEVLSYLNSQVAFLDPATETRQERSLEDVDQEIALHLKCLRDDGEDSLQQLSSFSAKQIRAKLSRLSAMRKETEYDEDDWTVIYMRGFACLDWADDGERQERMARRAREIKHNWKIEYLHSPRRTRADSQAYGGVQNSTRKTDREPYKASDPYRRRIATVRNAGSRPLKQRGTIDGAQHVSNTESLATESGQEKAIKIESNDRETPVSLSVERDRIHGARLLLRDSQELSESESRAFGTPLRAFSLAGNSNAISDKGIEGSPSTPSLSERLQAVEKELQIVKRDKSDSELEIDFWKAEYRTAQYESLKWMKAKDVLAAKINALQGPNQSEFSSDDRIEHEALLDELLDERNSRRHIQSMERRPKLGQDDETMSMVFRSMQEIGDRLRVALENAKFSPVAELRTLPQDHTLRTLVEQALGVERHSPRVMEVLESWHENPSLRRAGLLAWCGAALARWVFQQSAADIMFDRFQGAGTRSSTSRYRDAMRLVGYSDPALARTVDTMVHKDLVDENLFEHFQRAKGRHLAHKLREALAPLCELDACIGKQSDVDSQIGDGYAVGQLSHAFFSAIDVQCRLVLTGWRYGCAWHEPGAPFDKTSMTPYCGEAVDTADAPTVRLTLLPGINQITADRIGVDFGGFAEPRHRGYEEAKCMVPAVVLCGSMDLH